jgi:hypothetical protein
VSARAEALRESAPTLTVPEQSGSDGLRRGCFEVSFPAEDAAKAAARDARAVGFVVAIRERDLGGWLIVSRRNNAFPADDGDRYASRLRAIAGLHGGTYDRFVPE